MKYILNESPVLTTNNFNMNSISLDLNIPSNYNYHDYVFENINDINISEKNNFISSIGLKHDKYINIDINKENYVSDQISNIKYIFKEDDNLVDVININATNKSNLNILLEYVSNKIEGNYHNGVINITSDNNSNINLTIINKLNKKSINMIDFNTTSRNNSNITINLVDVGGSSRVYRSNSITKEESNSNLNGIYIGKDKEIIDMCFNYINEEPKSINNIEFEGILYDNSRKHFKGIIDFKSGCKKSIGKENENCLLLSDDAISRSLPILLCGEEDVEGAHSVSSGMIDNNKLFYLTSRGINESDAKKIIIKTHFQKALSIIPESIKEYINNIIDELVN